MTHLHVVPWPFLSQTVTGTVDSAAHASPCVGVWGGGESSPGTCQAHPGNGGRWLPLQHLGGGSEGAE